MAHISNGELRCGLGKVCPAHEHHLTYPPEQLVFVEETCRRTQQQDHHRQQQQQRSHVHISLHRSVHQLRASAFLYLARFSRARSLLICNVTLLLHSHLLHLFLLSSPDIPSSFSLSLALSFYTDHILTYLSHTPGVMLMNSVRSGKAAVCSPEHTHRRERRVSEVNVGNDKHFEFHPLTHVHTKSCQYTQSYR